MRSILISSRLYGKQRSCVLLHDISDHFPSLVIIEDAWATKKSPKKVKTRTIDECNLTALKSDLSSIKWSEQLTMDNINSVYDGFMNELSNLIDEHLPVKEIILSSKQRISEPWLTKNLLKCGKTQLKLYERSLKSKNPNDIERYKQYRTVFQRIKRRCKLDYFNNQCTKFKNDTKRLWHTINNINNGNNDKSCTIDYIKKDNIIISDGSKITKEFGHYFATIGKKVSMKGGNSKKHINDYLYKIPINPKSVFLTPCTNTEINNLISQLPNKNSCGHDEITNVLLKKLGPYILEPLSLIFNMSLETGKYPDSMKLADVIPLFKGGNQHLLNNYRPISLLPTISKLLEKIMYSRIYEFLDGNNVFFTSQYGFRKKHSCEHAITELIGEICKGLENGKHTISLFIDLSKAFDTISHNILFNKLERYGIRGKALDWFKCYLTNRKMRAKCNVSSSSDTLLSPQHQLDIGTPQGSVLGPLLFLIFCNDLYLNLELCYGILFADDTTVYKSHTNLKYLEWCLKHDMKILIDWFKANHLSLNSNKTVGMLFSTKNQIMEKIMIENFEIKMVDTTKFLGIWIDRKLTWKTHLQHIINKIKRNINLLKLGHRFLSTHAKRLIYFAQIQSHLGYGLSI